MLYAVIRKDLRLHAPWLFGAFLLSLIYSAVDLLRWPETVNWFSVLMPFIRSYSTDMDPTPPLMRIQNVAYFASVYGFVLGLVQSFADTQTTADFFFHRPCSRTRLGVAKLLAGTLLYWAPGVATIVIITIWSALGAFASPFRLSMVSVPLVSWWIGYAFYLAAVNAAWRPGRWYASRLLPLAVPIIAASMMEFQPWFFVVFVLALVTTTIFWIANIHLLNHAGVERPSLSGFVDKTGRLLDGLILSVGLIAVISFASSILISFLPEERDYRRVVFTRDGEPRIQKYRYDESGRQIIEWLNVNHERVAEFENHDDAPALNTASVNSTIMNWSARLASPLRDYWWSNPRMQQTFWYILARDGVVEGYRHPGGRLVARLGPDGTIESDGGQFFDSLVQSYSTRRNVGHLEAYSFDHLLGDAGSLYGLTLNPPNTRTFWQSTVENIDAFGLVSPWREKLDVGHVFVQSGTSLTVLDGSGEQLGVIQIPEQLLRRKWYFNAGFTGERIVLTAWKSADSALAYTFTPTGELVEEWNIALREPKPATWWISPPDVAVSLCVSPFVSLAVVAGNHGWPWSDHDLTVSMYWPLLLLSTMVTLLAVAAVHWHLVNRSTRRCRIAWLVTAALLNWPAFFICTMLLRLPSRIRCADCGHPRSPASANCPRCAAPWPAPGRNETEILLPASP